MLETGFDNVMPNPDMALLNYKHAYTSGDSNALINIAIYHLNVSKQHFV